jgi:predicted neuraminidase
LSAFFRPVKDPPVILRAHSHDLGNSWSSLIQTSLPCPLSGVSAFAAEDKLAIVYNHSTEHKRSPLSLSTSSDGGVSWSSSVSLDSPAFEVSYPSFVTDRDGMVHGVYTFNRRMIKYVGFSLKDLP